MTRMCIHRCDPLVVVLGVCCLLVSGCNRTYNDDKQVIINKVSSSPALTWEQLVTDSFKVVLSDTAALETLTMIVQLEQLRSGEVVVPVSRINSVFVADQDGTIRKRIQKNGKGPGEFEVLGRIAVDDEDHIYIYDPAQGKLTRFIAPDYEYFEEVFSKYQVSKFLVLSSMDKIAAYSPYAEYLFNLFDMAGDKHLARSVLPDDANFKIWLSRIQTGGIVRDREKSMLYGLYPEKLAIYRFTEDLELLDLVLPASDKIFYEPFPANLSPYSYTRAHNDWWATMNQLARIFVIESGIVAVTYDATGSSVRNLNGEYVNIYDLNKGEILANDVPLPPGASIVGAGSGSLWVAYTATIDEQGNEVPFELYRYSVLIP